MTEKVYTGYRLAPERGSGSLVAVHVNGEPLRHIVVHSPDGFNWGYGGSGPADLALSILADFFGEAQSRQDARQFRASGCPKALEYHQRFKWAFVCHWNDEWRIDSRTIRDWLASFVV